MAETESMPCEATERSERLRSPVAVEGEQERTLRTLLGNLPGMAYRCRNDGEWTMLFVSEGSVELTGYRPDELVDNAVVAFGSLIDPDDATRVWDGVQAALELRESWTLKYRISTADGSKKWVWERGVGVRDDDTGDLLALEGFISDVTEAMTAQQELEESEREIAALLSSLPGMAFRCAPEPPWNDEFLSEGVKTLTDYDVEDLVSGDVTWVDITHRDDRTRVENAMTEAKRELRPWSLDYRIITKAGELRWVNERGVPVTDSFGDVQALEGLITDITALKEAQAQLAERERVLSSILSNVPGVVYRSQIEAPWKDEFIGSGVDTLTGYAAEDIIAGRPSHEELMHPDDVLALEEATRAAVEARRPAEVEYRIRCADGSEKWLADRFIVLRDAQDRPTALDGLLIDVTAHHLAEKALARSRAELDLHACIATLFLTRPSNDAFPDALDLIRERMASRWGFLGFLDENGDLVAPALSRDAWEACQMDDKSLRFPREGWGDTVYGAALREGETRRLEGSGRVPPGHVPIEHAIATPISHGEKTIGIIAVAGKAEPYADEDAHLLEGVASYVGPILHEWRERTLEERARRSAEDALRESESQYRTLYEQNPAGVFQFGTDLVVQDCNEALLGMLHSPREAFQGRRLQKAIRNRDPLAAIEASVRGETAAYEGPVHTDVADLDLWLTLNVAPRLNGDGKIIGGIAVVIDRTRQRRAEEQMQHLLLHDSLTGLPNRDLLLDRIKQAVAHARRRRLSFAVAVLEIDRFASFRDTLGAVGADQLVAVVAERVTGAVREEDTVARVGDHQIAIVIVDASGPADVGVVLSSVLDALAAPTIVGKHELYVASKVGVAIYPSDGADGDELLRNAEVAAGRAMGNGKHRWQFFHSSMNAEHDRRLELEADLHRALERGQLVLHYQPQVAAGTGDIVAIEALLRWQHPERGLVPPMDFIPLAEESGLMVPIGAWVLREACANAAIWNQRCGFDTRVCVNLSLRQLHSSDLPDVVAEALRASGLHPSLLELEITESLAMSDPDITARVLRAFGEAGIRVALDDFGTGYSSLSHVMQLPVDTVKIDRSFVRNLTDVPQHAAVASAVITLSHRLGLSVVAEGVETANEHVFLHQQGCDLIQGFFFSRPVPAEECERLLKGRTLIP